MKIYIESSQDQLEVQETVTRNIANVFDIDAIKKELEQYDLSIETFPIRRINDKLWAMYIEAVSRITKGSINKTTARDALIVNYNNNTAMCMPRNGSDKKIMLLISSIANKHIKPPFVYDEAIRYEM